ncbi:MAG: hypothetical protein JST54_32555 [Deltaproteobacteria bacterium]|nr:hypothetical protein [Deltaproteobacteria bacterium]
MLVFDTGDTLFTPGLAPITDADRRRADLQSHAFATLGYSALAVGELDLRDGLANLRARMDKDKLPYLSANLVDASGARPFPPSKLLDGPQGKVGVVAVTAFDGEVAGLHAEDPAVALKREVAALRSQGATTVVGLVHAPRLHVDPVLKDSGVDLVLIGHDGGSGMVIRTPPGFASGQKGRALMRVSLELGEGPVVDGNAAEDAKNEVKMLDNMLAMEQQRLGTAHNDQARDFLNNQMKSTRERREKALKRAEAPSEGRMVSSHPIQLDERVPDEPELAKQVDAEVTADGHSPAR